MLTKKEEIALNMLEYIRQPYDINNIQYAFELAQMFIDYSHEIGADEPILTKEEMKFIIDCINSLNFQGFDEPLHDSTLAKLEALC